MKENTGLMSGGCSAIQNQNTRTKKVGIIILVMMIAILATTRPCTAQSLTRYATQKIALREKANGKVLLKVKRNTKLYLTREGKRWAVVRYKGDKYVTLKKYLNTERLTSRKKARYYINYLRTRGPVYWHDRKYTYFTSRLCPIHLLPVPGLHIDKNGIWCDKNDYIVLGSSVDNKVNRRIIATPFGKYGRVYDTGGWSTPGWLMDTAVNW